MEMTITTLLQYTIQTPQTRTPGVPGVRVMVRRRHYRRTTPLDRTPRPGFLTKERIASPMCTAFKMQIKVDKTNRGEELLDLLGTGAFPYGKSRENADQMVEAVKDHLQRMTGRNFVVSGILNGKVIMKGQENLRDNVDEMTIKLKLAMMVPAPLVIIAYQIITESATENVERSPREVKSDDLKREVTPLASFDEKKSENPKKQRSCPTPMDVAPSQAETPAPMERASLQTRIKPEERTSLQNRPPRTDRKETLQANSTMRSEPRQPPTARSRIPENSRARIKSIKSDLDRRDHNRLSQEYSGLPSSAKKHGKTRHSGMEIMDMIPSSAKKHAKTRLSSVEPTEKESTHHAPTPNRLRSNKSAASSPATPRVKPTKQESEQIANAKQVTL